MRFAGLAGLDVFWVTPAVVQLMWGVTGLMLLVLLVSILLRRASAALRHRVWSLGMVAVLALPLLVAALPQWRLGPEPAVVAQMHTSPPLERKAVERDGFAWEKKHAIQTMPTTQYEGLDGSASRLAEDQFDASSLVMEVPAGSETEPVAGAFWGESSADTSSLWLAILFGVWAAGTVAGLLRILWSFCWIRRVLRQTQEIYDPTCERIVHRLVKRIMAVDRPAAGLAVVLLTGVAVLSPLPPVNADPDEQAPADEMDLQEAGKIPVMFRGRIKPLDTFARDSLRIISNNRESFTTVNGERQPAIRWLLDVITERPGAEMHPVFYIPHPEILDTLELEPRKDDHYSLADLLPNIAKFEEQVEQPRELQRQGQTDQLRPYQRRLLELDRRILRYTLVSVSFRPLPFPEFPTEEDFRQDRELTTQTLMQVRRLMEAAPDAERQLMEMEPPLAVPPAEEDQQWTAYGPAWNRMYLQQALLSEETNPATVALAAVFDAYAEDDVSGFNRAVASYHQLLVELRPKPLNDQSADLPGEDEIRQAWQRREQFVQSARITWNEQRIRPPDVATMPDDEMIQMDELNMTTDFYLSFQGTRFRHEREGTVPWAGDGEVSLLWRTSTNVSNGQQRRGLTKNEQSDFPQGSISEADTRSLIMNDITMQPVMFAFRILEPEMRPMDTSPPSKSKGARSMGECSIGWTFPASHPTFSVF